MTTEINLMEITGVLEEMRSEMDALSARLAKLEAAIGAASAPAPAPAAEAVKPEAGPEAALPVPEPAEEEPISEEVLLAIAAAVAAYLGERAHIRQVRLIRTGAWAQEGRVSIQASHRLH